MSKKKYLIIYPIITIYKPIIITLKNNNNNDAKNGDSSQCTIFDFLLICHIIKHSQRLFINKKKN